MKKQILTARSLGKILYEEFKKDSWGMVDPTSFRDPQKTTEADPEDMGGLYEVLERVAERINDKY